MGTRVSLSAILGPARQRPELHRWPGQASDSVGRAASANNAGAAMLERRARLRDVGDVAAVAPLLRLERLLLLL